MKNNVSGIFLVVGAMIILGVKLYTTNSKLERCEERRSRMIDSEQLREFTFYYHSHDGELVVHKRIYVTTPSDEPVLSKYLIDDQESSDAWPYFDRVDSISIATLDTLSIGHNYPCKMFRLQWKEKIIWRKQ